MDPFGGQPLDLKFHLAIRAPQQFMMDIAGGPEWMNGLPYTVTCNGAERWVYPKRKPLPKGGAGRFQ